MSRSEEGTVSKIRVTLDLPEPFHRRLTELEKVTHKSRADVIRHALQVYEFIAKKTINEGYKFYSVDKEGERERIAFVTPDVADLEPETEAKSEKEHEGALVGA